MDPTNGKIAISKSQLNGKGKDPLLPSQEWGWAKKNWTGSKVRGLNSFEIEAAQKIAVEIEKKDNPLLWNTVENLCIESGLPMPKVYITPERQINAFATGRDPQHAVVCATTGLLAILNKTELEGVIAHELSHVGNRDMLLSAGD